MGEKWFNLNAKSRDSIRVSLRRLSLIGVVLCGWAVVSHEWLLLWSGAAFMLVCDTMEVSLAIRGQPWRRAATMIALSVIGYAGLAYGGIWLWSVF
jgi:hypothetical protein